MKNKKILVPIIIIVALLIGVGIFVATRKKQPTDPVVEQPQKKKITEPVNVIDVAERPYVIIKPHLDGRNLTLTIADVKKEATDADYELEYQAGSLLQGAFGNIVVAELPAEEKILLGSCSAGGACTYHEDVRGGTLLLRFNGPENYALKSDWRYFINSTRETEFSSKDAKFMIKSAGFSKQSYIIVYNSPGYPKGLEGTLVSEIYSVVTSTDTTGTAEVSIRAKEEGGLKVMGWDGNAWQELTTTLDGEDAKVAKAEGEVMQAYVVVK